MVSEKRRKYMREYMRRKRALEKQVVRTETLASSGHFDQKLDFSRCPHCFSKHVTVRGTVISCQNCGIEIDVSVGYSENRFDERVI